MSKSIILCSVAGQPQALLIQTLLEANGIPVSLSQESAGQAWGFTVGPMSWVDILIPEVHLAEAQAILTSAQISAGEEAPDDDVANVE